jgi:hypothetical protein
MSIGKGVGNKFQPGPTAGEKREGGGGREFQGADEVAKVACRRGNEEHRGPTEGEEGEEKRWKRPVSA